MAISIEQFIKQVTASGLMTADEVTAFVAALPESEKPADAEALAKLLAKQKQLTPFQVQQIWKGEGEQLVLGNYVITEKLGQGGMGMVLKATHKLMKRDVALKVLSPDVIKDESAVQRFLREVEAAAKLTHPNIVAAHDADKANGAYFLIMEFVAGRDLSETVKKQGPAAIDQAVDFILQAARGLEYAHQNGVVHRDIKPANLLLDDTGTVKVLDMGLARIEDGGVDAATQAALTGTGAIMGTVDYMAPEQAEDTKSAGPQADIYSLGASLYYLLTGKSMVTGTAIGKKLKMLMTGEGLPESITGLRSEVSADLDAVFQKMTAFDMADRYQTMTEVIADLEAIKAGGVPSSGSTAGIQPVATRSDESAMNSLMNKLGDGTVTTGPTVLATPQAVEASDTMVDSVDDATRTAFKKTATFTKAVTEPKNRKLLIGGAVAACLFVGAIIWSLSGDNGGKGKDNSTAIHDPKKDTTAGSSSNATAPLFASAPFDETQAKAHQNAWAKHLDEPVETTNSIGMKFVVIPPGKFKMGEGENVVDATVTTPFRLGIHTVTQSQWKTVMGSEPWKGQEGVIDGENIPATFVTCTDAMEFCRQLSARERTDGRLGEGWEYRLPTETEWEYACRAGTTTKFGFGDDESRLPYFAWYKANTRDVGEAYAHPVGLKFPNPWGLYDVHGNVREWCLDGYNGYKDAGGGTGTDPTNAVDASYRVHRGGGWGVPAKECRLAVGKVGYHLLSNNYLGFRVVLSRVAEKAPTPAVAPFNEVQAKVQQKAWAKHLKLPVEHANSIGMKFVVIPPGECQIDQKPEKYNFTLTKPYRLGVHEVTQGQWKRVMQTEPWLGQDEVREGDDNPAVFVKKQEAIRFCQKLTEIERQAGRLSEGEAYRLPTAAEWDFACRAGSNVSFSFGDKKSRLKEYAWFNENALNAGEEYAHPVGRKQPNAWGLHDMHGNVWELCSDFYFRKRSSGRDPRGPARGTKREMRGGSWRSTTEECMSSSRTMTDNPSSINGFRVAITIDISKIGKTHPAELTRIDLPDGEPGEALRIPHSVIQHPNNNHLAFLNDKLVLTASTNGTPTTFRVPDGVPQRKLERAWFDGGKVGAIRFAQSSNHLFGGLTDGRVCLWDIESGKIEKYFGEPAKATQDNKIFALSVSSDEKSVAVAQPQGLVRVWDVETGRQIGTRQMELQARCAFLPDSQQLALLSGTQLAIWDVVNDRIENTYPHGLAASTDFRISPDGRYAIACDGRRPAAFCLNLQTGDVRQFSSPDAPAYFATISPDSRWMYAGGILYDLETLQPALDLTKEANGTPNGSWRQVTYAPDGRFLVVHVYSEEKAKQAIVFWRLPEKFWPEGTRREVGVPPPATAPFDEAQAKVHQKSWADHLGLPVEKEVTLPGGAKMKFMLIPPGEFMMGSSKEEQVQPLQQVKEPDEQYAAKMIRSEGPQHLVRFEKPFLMGKYEVTQAQWQAVMGDNPSRVSNDPAFPVDNVSWDDTQRFLTAINKLNPAPGMRFSLPTEAQWEYSCRAGTTTPWYGSENEAGVDELGWTVLNANDMTHRVGRLKANAFGLHDCYANVWEWCADWHSDNYFAESQVLNPAGPTEGHRRIVRGGSFIETPQQCRSAGRGSQMPNRHYGTNGFRLAMTFGVDKTQQESVPLNANLTRGLVGHWNFEVGGGQEIVDTSGKDNHGTLKDNPLQSDDAPPSPYAGRRSLKLDGRKNWIDVPHTGSLSPKENLTVMLWLRGAGSNDDIPVIELGNVYRLTYPGHFHVGTITGGRQFVKPSAKPEKGWHHLAGRYDGKTIELFRDGIRIASHPQTGELLENQESVLVGSLFNVDKYFDGWIDDVRIYDRALSDAEISVLAGKATEAEKAQNPSPAIAPFNEAQAKAHQKAWADHLGLPVEKEVALPGGAKMNLMLIPPGEFLMGSTDEERARLLAEAKAADDTWAIDRIPHEGPQHRVRITKPFYLGKFEVTQAQWQSVMGNNSSQFKNNPSHPVEHVSWDDIQSFLAKLNESKIEQSITFSLPTEAQWEYACRSGTTTAFYSGDREGDLKQYGWSAANSGGKTNPVGELTANGFGLYDMHGNVWEWCVDCFASDYYAKAPIDDPSGPTAGLHRIFRGGCWGHHARLCRSAIRLVSTPDHRNANVGFRLAMTIDTTQLKAVETPLANPERAVAEWVLSLDGFVMARRQDAPWTENAMYRKAADLPPGPLVVAEVNFTPSRTFPADELTRLSQLQKLKTLSLNNKRIDDDDLRHLAPLTTITDLYLNGTGVTGAGLAHFKEHSLVIFNCVEPKFSDEGLKQLSRMDRLQAITVKSANITNDGLKHLSDLSKLKVLDISNTPIDDNGLQALTDLKSLQELRLLKTRVTAAGVAALQKALPGCKIEWDGTNTKAAQPDNAKDDSTQ